MKDESGGRIDVLDLVAHRHRSLQHRLHDLAEDGVSAADALDDLARDLLSEESLKRVLLHPLLARTSDGESTVERRREEQYLLVHHTARVLALASEQREDELEVALREMYQTLIGHTDREELEDSPRVREHASPRELEELAVVHEELQVAIDPATSEAVRLMPQTDPLTVLETEIERCLGRPATDPR